MARFELSRITETGLPALIVTDGDTSMVIARFTRYVPGLAEEIVENLNKHDGDLENEQADTGQEDKL